MYGSQVIPRDLITVVLFLAHSTSDSVSTYPGLEVQVAPWDFVAAPTPSPFPNTDNYGQCPCNFMCFLNL